MPGVPVTRPAGGGVVPGLVAARLAAVDCEWGLCVVSVHYIHKLGAHPAPIVMYLVYVDESGKPTFKDPENFVLGAVVIQESHYHAIDLAVNAVKERYFALQPQTVEIHTMDMVYRRNRFQALSLDQCQAMFRDVAEVVAQSQCTLLASVIVKSRVFPHLRDKQFDPLEWGHRLLFERACNLLAKINASRGPSQQEHGILLIDAVERRHDARLRTKLVDFYRSGSHYVKNQFLIDEPIFVSSQYRNLSQLADFVAFVVRRYHREVKANNLPDALAREAFERIKNRFDTSPNGKLDGCGIKKFP
jgi:hypothetical protein